MVLLLLTVAKINSGCWGYHVRLPRNWFPGPAGAGCRFNRGVEGAVDTSRGRSPTDAANTLPRFEIYMMGRQSTEE